MLCQISASQQEAYALGQLSAVTVILSTHITAKEFIYKQVQLKGLDQALVQYSQTHKEKALAGLSVSAIKKHFIDL